MPELQCLAAFMDEANIQAHMSDENRYRIELCDEVYGKVDVYQGKTLLQCGLSVKEAEIGFAWMISPLSLVKAA